MQTVQQLLFDAVEYGENLLAHAVFVSLQEGLVSSDDPANQLDYTKVDIQKVQRMTEENFLALDLVKLFTAPLEAGTFAFILAKKEEDAVTEFIRKYQRKPTKMIDMSMDMDRSLYFEETNKHMSFRQIKNQVEIFPYFVCEFQKTT